MIFHKDVLQLDAAAEAARIVESMRKTVLTDFRRKGAVVGVSGGVDSATVLMLAARAFGPERMLALLLPDQDSSAISETLGREVAAAAGVATLKVDLTAALAALGCYEYRDAAVRQVFPDYDPAREGMKIVLPGDLLERGSLNLYSVVLVDKDGGERRKTLPPAAYLDIVASSNMKQRTRMLTLYFQAERHNYAVAGTANKNEHDQGFFVKYGDGGVDIQTIGHLFKTQVYQLARYLGVPQGIIDRTPTTDTYSAECTQEEFYFRLPFELMDLIWYGFEHAVPAAEVASALALSEDQVARVYRDLGQKARSTAYLRAAPVMIDPLAVAVGR
jgi:NAD+ synthase